MNTPEQNNISQEDELLYCRCVYLVATERKASTSHLQRRFSIGYGRAAKMMDLMEARGVISPVQGVARTREVLVPPPQEAAADPGDSSTLQDLLHEAEAAAEPGEEEQWAMQQMQQVILSALAQSGITALPGPVTRGASITRYEFFPQKALTSSRLLKLNSLLMQITHIAPINILKTVPGRETMGIELANRVRTPVYLRELLQDAAFRSPRLRIPVALGKEVHGKAVIGDLAAMPHVLLAGAPGSGKSVCLNSMIISMLSKFSPEELKLLLVDPKLVEFKPFAALPHLACPVLTNPAKVISALRWATEEMEARGDLFSQVGVCKLEDYNELVDRRAGDEALARIPLQLPYIVIIIEELADLMMVVKEDLEAYIARLAQKGRAVGIHLILSTQTPSVSVLSALIKAGIPSRLAFRTNTALESRIVLETMGAELLLGQGDALFLPPGGLSRMTRIQGAYVSDDEVAQVVKHCAAHAQQTFHEPLMAEVEGHEAPATSEEEEEESLFKRCAHLVVAERRASTSFLQRRFSMGYGRAAQIMDMLEARGIISPPQGNSRARVVLVESLPEDGDFA